MNLTDLLQILAAQPEAPVTYIPPRAGSAIDLATQQGQLTAEEIARGSISMEQRLANLQRMQGFLRQGSSLAGPARMPPQFQVHDPLPPMTGPVGAANQVVPYRPSMADILARINPALRGQVDVSVPHPQYRAPLQLPSGQLALPPHVEVPPAPAPINAGGMRERLIPRLLTSGNSPAIPKPSRMGAAMNNPLTLLASLLVGPLAGAAGSMSVKSPYRASGWEGALSGAQDTGQGILSSLQLAMDPVYRGQAVQQGSEQLAKTVLPYLQALLQKVYTPIEPLLTAEQMQANRKAKAATPAATTESAPTTGGSKVSLEDLQNLMSFQQTPQTVTRQGTGQVLPSLQTRSKGKQAKARPTLDMDASMVDAAVGRFAKTEADFKNRRAKFIPMLIARGHDPAEVNEWFTTGKVPGVERKNDAKAEQKRIQGIADALFKYRQELDMRMLGEEGRDIRVQNAGMDRAELSARESAKRAQLSKLLAFILNPKMAESAVPSTKAGKLSGPYVDFGGMATPMGPQPSRFNPFANRVPPTPIPITLEDLTQITRGEGIPSGSTVYQYDAQGRRIQ